MPESLLELHEDGNYYDATKSTSSGGQLVGESFDLGFGSGTVSGNVFTDTVIITGDGDMISVGGNPIECALT
jgi:hypothetical protein